MNTRTTVKVILALMVIIAVSVGGYSIYHYGQVAPVLHNKQPADGSNASLTQQTAMPDSPSATQLQVVAVQPTDSKSVGSSPTSSLDQPTPTPGASQPNTLNPSSLSAASPQASALSLQTPPVVGIVQGVVGGILNGGGVNLQL